jgi:ecotin
MVETGIPKFAASRVNHHLKPAASKCQLMALERWVTRPGGSPPIRCRRSGLPASPMRTIVSFALAAVASISIVFADDDMKAFPPAEEGMTRHVIRLPKRKDEASFKVELIIGKPVKTDAVNSYFFGGTLEAENIPGWGFTRYILHQLGPMAGTMMAVDPNAPQVERFISVGTETILRYNSRLPFVVYVPQDVQVRYRLWRAGPTLISQPDVPR